jgi:PhzF family phenazine biosynthesis protein
MGLPLFVVDAFASIPFSGNPAAVCVLPQPRDEAWMRLVAREMNLSETAFVSPGVDGSFELRWFTPAVEVALCGHATLATAHVLWEIARVDRFQAIRFQTKSGLLTATRDGKGEGIALDFPATTPAAAEAPAGLQAALGCPPPIWVGRERENVFVELEREADVRALAPAFSALLQVEGRGFTITARGDAGTAYDFVSRYFAPRVGIPEDPVTGSAHCALAMYWAPRLGKAAMTGFQASARGGVVRVRPEGNRVRLGGDAVTISRGELLA